MKRESQLERLHKNQNKTDCFVSVGDMVKITCINGYSVSAVIVGYDLKKETTTEYKGLHPCMDIAVLPYDEKEKTYADMATIWIENIVELEVLQFKGENNNKKTKIE
jgi:hypothetical protein